MASQFALVPYRLQSKLPAEMAHADRDTTQRYVHLSKEHLEDAQKKMERFRMRQRTL